MRLALSIIFFNCLFCLDNQAQNLGNERSSSLYTYIYRVPSAYAFKTLKKEETDLKGLINYSCVDSFFTDSVYKKELPPGHYLLVKAKGRALDISYKCESGLIATVLPDYCHAKLLVRKKDGDTINPVSVLDGCHIIKYNTRAQAYLLRSNKRVRYLTIQIPGDTLFYKLAYNNDRRTDYDFGRSVRSTFYRIRSKFRSAFAFHNRGMKPGHFEGYIVFNKPVYQPNDTVKLKAFLTRYNGKALNKALNIQVRQGWYDEEWKTLQANLKPVSKGAYVFQFVLSDSFKIDQQYNLRFSTSRGKEVKSDYFKIEDYLLHVNQYQLSSDRKNYALRDTIRLTATGKDLNGLPVMDGRVKITATTYSIDEFDSDKVFVPDTLFVLQKELDAGGKCVLVYPGQSLPNATFDIRIYAEFANSNNEIWDTSLTIAFGHKHKELSVNFRRDSIVAEYLYYGRPQTAKAHLAISAPGKILLSSSEVELPYKAKIDPFAESYFFTRDSAPYANFIYVNVQDGINCIGYRTDTNAFFKVINPYNLQFYYSLYKNSVLIEQGASANFEKDIKDAGASSYQLNLQYEWQGRRQSKIYHADNAKNELQIDIESKDIIYPGQLDTFHISVNKFNEHPARHVNLTAYSVNEQFQKKLRTPQVPAWGKTPRVKKRYFNPEIEPAAFSASPYLYHYPEWQHRMNLESLAYFRMVYHRSAMSTYIDSLPDSTAQLAVYIFKDGKGIKIYGTYIDGKLVYSQQNQINTPYSFTASAGKHAVSIRTIDREIKLDSVALIPGHKLEVSCNYDSLLKDYPKPNRPKSYTETERNELAKSMLLLDKKVEGDYMLWQGNRVFKNNSYSYSNTPRIAGPFKYDYINFRYARQANLSFLPDANYTFSFWPLTRMEKYEAFKNKIKLAAKFDFEPPRFGEIEIPPADVIEIIKPHEKYKINQAEFGKRGGKGRLRFEMSSDSVFRYMRIYQYDTGGFNQTYDHPCNEFNLRSGVYQVMFITESDNYFLLPDMEVQANGLNYYHLHATKLLKILNSQNLKVVKPIDSLSTGAIERFKPNQALYGSAVLTGKVKDSQGEEVPYATVSLMKGDRIIATEISDANGNYNFQKVPDGIYSLRVNYIGCEPALIKDISIRNDLLNLVNIVLKDSPKSLQEVMIVSKPAEHYYAYDKVEQSLSVQALGISVRNEKSKAAGRVVYCPSFLGNADSTILSGVPYGLYAKNAGKAGNSKGEDLDAEKLLSGKYANAKSLRNNFRDYGIWEPNIVTDKNGQATFTAQYPDNMTAWNTYVLGMDGQRRSGMSSKTVRSFKEMSATLNAPQFLIEGDSTYLQGKILNYTGVALKATASFSINGGTETSKGAEIKDVWTDYLGVLAQQLVKASDTVKATFKFSLPSGFSDGEEKSIPIFPRGTVEAKGIFKVLNRDTDFVFTPDASMSQVTVYAESDLLKVLLDEIKHLKDYPYWCTEQTASKLIALSMEAKIDSVLSKPFKEQGEKKRVEKKLLGMQLYNGAFGWWEYAAANIHLTNYVPEALYKAGVKPNSGPNLKNASDFLKYSFTRMNNEEKLHTLETLAQYTDDKDYAGFHLKEIKYDSLTLNQQLRFAHVQLLCGTDSSEWNKLKTKKHAALLGGIYWGEETLSFINNSTASTLLAYQMAEMKNEKGLQDDIITYLLKTRGHESWMNTFESAEILSAILPRVVEQYGKKLEEPSLKINGNSVSHFPYTVSLPATQNINVNKKGSGPLYFTAYQQFFNNAPVAVKDVFDVRTYFEQGGKQVSRLKAGERVVLTVTVNAKKYAEYISIEIPIPAGCTYAQKDFPHMEGEVHREYFKNKVVIFCESLHEGTSTFKVLLEPRYSGKYTINPAKAELMYFPTFFGRNEMKSIRIENL